MRVPMTPDQEQEDRERILRLQCLAAVEPSIIQKARLKRAQEIYDFVTTDDTTTTKIFQSSVAEILKEDNPG